MEPTETGATDLDGAAARLSARLQAEQSLPTDEQKAEGQEGQAQEQDAKPAGDQASDETPKGDTDALKELHKVKVNGEEKEVTYEELLLGYSREDSFRQKTMKHAEEINSKRAELDAKAAKVDEQLNEAKGLLEDQISNLESPEMLELKEIDPEAYLKEVDRVQAKIKKFETLKQKRLDEHQKRVDAFKKKQLDALKDAFPEWDDIDKGTSELNKVLIDMGIKEDEISSTAAVDHRMYLMANEIQKGRNAIKELEAIRKANLEAKEVKSKPKSSKPGNPVTPEDRQRSDISAMRQKLRKTGKLDDAVALLSMK